MKRHFLTGLALAVACGVFPATASADLLTFTGSGANLGLSATAEFTRINATTLKVVLTNTSTSLPAHMNSGDSAANRLLTSLAFRLPGTVNITGGSAVKTAGSVIDNYGNVNGDNLGKEWGWGWNGTGQCCEETDPSHAYNDWISTLSAGTTQFKSGSLDGSGLNGPKWGLASNALPSAHESVRNSATFTLNLSGAGIPDLSFLANSAVVEFGSDAAFLTSTLVGPPPPGAPEPAALLLLGMGIAGWARHRRKK